MDDDETIFVDGHVFVVRHDDDGAPAVRWRWAPGRPVVDDDDGPPWL